MSGRPGYVYRAYDADDLLYVGSTINPGARLYDHQGEKDWWADVVTITLTHFATREEAFSAEAAAITAEQPRYNIIRNPGPDAEAMQRRLETRRRNREEAEREEAWKEANGWRPLRGNERLFCSNCRCGVLWIPKGVLLADLECDTCGCAGNYEWKRL